MSLTWAELIACDFDGCCLLPCVLTVTCRVRCPSDGTVLATLTQRVYRCLHTVADTAMCSTGQHQWASCNTGPGGDINVDCSYTTSDPRAGLMKLVVTWNPVGGCEYEPDRLCPLPSFACTGDQALFYCADGVTLGVFEADVQIPADQSGPPDCLPPTYAPWVCSGGVVPAGVMALAAGVPVGSVVERLPLDQAMPCPHRGDKLQAAKGCCDEGGSVWACAEYGRVVLTPQRGVSLDDCQGCDLRPRED